jgi:hypothetical protein
MQSNIIDMIYIISLILLENKEYLILLQLLRKPIEEQTADTKENYMPNKKEDKNKNKQMKRQKIKDKVKDNKPKTYKKIIEIRSTNLAKKAEKQL